MFDHLYVDAILHPENIEVSADTLLAQIRSEAETARKSLLVFGEATELDSRDAKDVLAHPLPFWIEQMTVSYLESHGGRAQRHSDRWTLVWPDGATHEAVFSSQDAELCPDAKHFTLESPRVREMISRLPQVVPEQPISIVGLPNLQAEVQGTWSLWRIEVHDGDGWNRYRILPLFIHDDGRVLAPTARRIWDELLSGTLTAAGHVDAELGRTAFARATESAEQAGEMAYKELVQMNRNHAEEQVQAEMIPIALVRIYGGTNRTQND
jgi:hypothetical protein